MVQKSNNSRDFMMAAQRFADTAGSEEYPRHSSELGGH